MKLAALVYFKRNGFPAIATLLDKSWSEIFAMKDNDCIAFCTDAEGIFATNLVVLGPFGFNAGVMTIIADDITAFTDDKPVPVSAQMSKNAGGDEIDGFIVVIMDLLADSDKMIPDAFGDTNPMVVRDYVQKRVEHTVGNRHNIVAVSVKKNPGLVNAMGAVFTVKDEDGNVIKELTMGISGTNQIDSIRNREYLYEVSCAGCITQTGSFDVVYQGTLTLDFILEPVV